MVSDDKRGHTYCSMCVSSSISIFGTIHHLEGMYRAREASYIRVLNVFQYHGFVMPDRTCSCTIIGALLCSSFLIIHFWTDVMKISAMARP